MSRSAWAGAATTVRSDDLEFLAIRRVTPAGPRPPVPASAGWPQAESVRARARRLRAFASLPIVDVRRLAWDERADFAAFLATLSPQQWQAPTLCARRRVRDVVPHVISYDELDARGLLAHAVPAGSGQRRRPSRIRHAHPRATAGIADRSPATPGAAGGAGGQGRTRRAGNSSPGHPARARTTARDSAGTVAARAAYRVDRSGHWRPAGESEACGSSPPTSAFPPERGRRCAVWPRRC